MDKRGFKTFEIIALIAIIILVAIYMSLDKNNLATNTITSIITSNNKNFYGIITEKKDDYIVVSPDYNSNFRRKTESLKVNVINSDTVNIGDRINVIYKENNENNDMIKVLKIEKVTDDNQKKEFNNKYVKLNDLSLDYNIEQAKNDGCYIYYENEEYNADKLNDFVNKIKNNENSYIRIVQKTVDNKLIILDVQYANETFLVSIDTRRDTSRIENERKIYNYSYKGINSYNDVAGTYLYLYNGNEKVTKNNINEIDCLLIGFRMNSQLK